ncbi:MAG: hypothetical protein JNL57_06310 [Bacteroidetes bacterium]|nr:hypothetical protein [Bacteroidota bacterium]
MKTRIILLCVFVSWTGLNAQTGGQPAVAATNRSVTADQTAKADAVAESLQDKKIAELEASVKNLNERLANMIKHMSETESKVAAIQADIKNPVQFKIKTVVAPRENNLNKLSFALNDASINGKPDAIVIVTNESGIQCTTSYNETDKKWYVTMSNYYIKSAYDAVLKSCTTCGEHPIAKAVGIVAITEEKPEVTLVVNMVY